MKRMIIAFVFILMLSFVMTGCGKEHIVVQPSLQGHEEIERIEDEVEPVGRHTAELPVFEGIRLGTTDVNSILATQIVVDPADYDFEIILPFIFDSTDIITIDPADYSQALTVEDIIALNNGDVRITTRDVVGVFTPELILSPEDAVKSLTSVRDILNIGSFSYTYRMINPERYSLRQNYKGVEVYHGSFNVYATIEGIPKTVTGHYINVGDIDVIPRISFQEALNSLELNEDARIWRARLTIWNTGSYSNDGDIYLCWFFEASEGETLSGDIVVDAHTGKIVSERWISAHPGS
jgi:hypothetical protein